MNGLGNEIIVADMRGSSARVTPAAAIALTPIRRQFDQMAITPRAPWHAQLHRDQSDGLGSACNGMRCVTQALAVASGERGFLFRNLASLRRGARRRPDQCRHGKPRFRWDDPLAKSLRMTGIELQNPAGPAYALRRPRWATPRNLRVVDVRHALDRFGPCSKPPDLSRARQHLPRWSRPITSSCAPGSGAPG